MSAVQPSSREHAAAIFRAGVAAADPYLAVKHFLRADSELLHIGSEQTGYRSDGWRRIHLLAFGKAACAMADAAQAIIPEAWLAGKGIVVTNYDNIDVVENCQVFGAGHPLPDAAGFHAAKTIANRLSGTNPDELVLVLISGGGSALLPYPAAGINLADKIATTQLLLASGAIINQINCVRKHLSQLKGGGLARLAAPADLHALILSDVLDNDLSAIASGPTVPDDTSFADAIAVLESFGIWRQIPSSVQSHLQQGAQGLQTETPKSGDAIFQRTGHTLIGSNASSVDAAIDKAQNLGYQTQVYSKQLCGEARLVAEQLALHALTVTAGMTQPTALIAGGETTVTLKGNGKGGRNQEMALAFALAAERCGLNGAWTFLSGGTDGRDGPTDAAGGVVNNHTLQRIRDAALDPDAMLDDNNAYPALKAANDLILCGATGTNVADLQILLLHPNA
ncbi:MULTISPECIES: glycerate kinase type-2 family protein [Methylomonas]|uniref:Glycerate kinase n=2 Tax=Methylomonas TaxID=416 RepID=A0A126T8G1_9GAMM|nr:MULTISPECIES: glycerate kinase [Methylomonas]AMK78367.1 glycerate kinase [Methylomonas denitrificans]OAI04077.1 glycerate kinase [Methylomonas methanica]TCV87603.1 glycerate 2-kinase [Methylomonas methanica]